MAKKRSLSDSKRFRNLDFATTSYGCSTPKLGRKLLTITSNKIHMLIFFKEILSGQKFGIEIFVCHFPSQRNREIGEFHVTFATSSA